MDPFDAVSPLDYRYYGQNSKAFEALQPFVSENARIRYFGVVEHELVKALVHFHIAPAKAIDQTKQAIDQITAAEVYAEEQKTRHDIRALANCIRNKVTDDVKPFIHLGATSYDIVDTANALRYQHAVQKALIPVLMELEKTLIDWALREKNTLQIGRTHGQHAEPITFGFGLSNYVSRLGNRIEKLEQASSELVGKFSGAVGAYNASSLLIKDPLAFEKQVVESLGLHVSVSSTQIAEPEPLVDLGHAIVSTLGVLADLSDDFRHLQRSEIAEIGEGFEKDQVGSSTMPHKHNPINFENVKSFWKQFSPRMVSVYSDQLSEHQRDLTNSASQRFFGELLVALFVSAERLHKTLSKSRVHSENMQRNFDLNRSLIVAEPLYILLAFFGHPNAHETAKLLSEKARDQNSNVLALAQQDASLSGFLGQLTPEQKKLLENPELYTGKAVQKTEFVCDHWKKKLKLK